MTHVAYVGNFNQITKVFEMLLSHIKKGKREKKRLKQD